VVTSTDRGICDAKIHTHLCDRRACEHSDSCGHGEPGDPNRQAIRVHAANNTRGCAERCKLGHVFTRHVFAGHVFTRSVFARQVSTRHVFARHVFTRDVFTRLVSNGRAECDSFVSAEHRKPRRARDASFGRGDRKPCRAAKRRKPLFVPECATVELEFSWCKSIASGQLGQLLDEPWDCRRLNCARHQPQYSRGSRNFDDGTTSSAIVTFAGDDGKRRAHLHCRCQRLSEQKGRRERRYAADAHAKYVPGSENSPPVTLSVKTEIFETKECCALSLRKRTCKSAH
jgi:hypothetical protein